MTCAQLDDLRDRGRSNTLSEVALEHMQACERCHRLQALLDSPTGNAELPPEVEQRISRYVLGTLKPVSPLPSNGAMVVLLAAIALVATTASTWIFGHNGFEKLARWQAAVIFVSIGICILIAAYCVVLQMIPGARQRLSPSISIGTTIAGLVAISLLIFPYAPDPSFVARGLRCWKIGLISAAGAAALFTLILRRSARMDETKLYAASALLSGLVGLGVLEMFCPFLDRTHISVWHIGSAVTFTLVGGLIGFVSSRIPKGAGLISEPATKL